MASSQVSDEQPDFYSLIGMKLLVPKQTWPNPTAVFGENVDGFAVGEILHYHPKRKQQPFNITFRNEKKLSRIFFTVDLKYIVDYIEELPEQFKHTAQSSIDECQKLDTAHGLDSCLIYRQQISLLHPPTNITEPRSCEAS